MTDDSPQPARREWRAHLGHPLTLAALSGTSAVLALVGPFGTATYLGLVERAAYWGGLVFAGYAVGYLCNRLVLPRARDGHRVVAILVAGGATGLAMTALVLLLNLVVFGIFPAPHALPGFAAQVLAISLIVMAVIDMFNRHLDGAAPAAPAPPAILNRLPLDKRGALVALSVEDHYVRVRTLRGETMLLMRLADAIGETGDTPGAQVHRSHWAAFGQVRAVRREGDRAILSMAEGGDIPVSRANIAKLKEAGLLAR